MIIDFCNLNTCECSDIGTLFNESTLSRVLTLENFSSDKIEKLDSTFANSEYEEVHIKNFEMPNLRSVNKLFFDCRKLKEVSIDISGRQLADITALFSRCFNLEHMDISKLCLSNVTHTTGAFYGCSKLTEIDLNSYDPKIEITHYYGTFFNCTGLKRIIVRDEYIYRLKRALKEYGLHDVEIIIADDY